MTSGTAGAGITVRSPTEDDAAAIVDLIAAAETADFGRSGYGLADLRRDWTIPGWDPATDGWLALAGDTPVCWTYLFERRHSHQVAIEVYLRPGGPVEIATDLIARALARAGDLATARGPLTAYLGLPATSPLVAAARAAGWSVVRHFYRMLRELDGTDRPPAGLPGVELRRVGAEDGDWRIMYDLLVEAFAEHWNVQFLPYDEWRAEQGRKHADPTLWWLARLDGVDVAALLASPDREGDGWINALGVLPAARGRGIGELLLRTAFAEFAARGKPTVALGVDAGNATGAVRLYERAGMHVAWRVDVLERAVG
ncbi:MAG: GNAT family N-acetyltransferase [Mycobacteriales bacterium]